MRVFTVILLAAALGLMSGQAQAAGLRRGYAMCQSYGALRRLVAASVANDTKRFRASMKGACRLIRGNEQSRVISRGKDVARITVKGRRGNWWTVAEALK